MRQALLTKKVKKHWKFFYELMYTLRAPEDFVVALFLATILLIAQSLLSVTVSRSFSSLALLSFVADSVLSLASLHPTPHFNSRRRRLTDGYFSSSSATASTAPCS